MSLHTYTCMVDRRLLRTAAREIAQQADDLADSHSTTGNLKDCPADVAEEIQRLRDIAKDLRTAAREGTTP